MRASKRALVPCELRAPEEFLKRRYNLLGMSAMRVALRAGFLAFQPSVDNTRGTRVEQVESSFQKILRGSQLTWYRYIVFALHWIVRKYLGKNVSDFENQGIIGK